MTRLLHFYQCSFCKTTAKATIKTARPPLKCVLCLRLMAFKFSTEVPEDEWQERNARRVEFTSPHEVAEFRDTTRKCDQCRAWVDKDKMIVLQGVGRFCTEDCAQAGVLDHQQFMERIRKVRTEMPWLNEPQKETA